MDYSIVIATRNRLQALRLSVPRMLRQSRPPSQLIVVDSSDEHSSVARAINEMVEPFSIKLIVKESPRGLTIQRNIGLELVEAPIVFFPDDDSIFFPEVAKEIMETYERDRSGRISAVCAAESIKAPSDFEVSSTSYKMTRTDKIKIRTQVLRSRIERYFFPDPGVILGRSFYERYPLEETQRHHNVVPVEWMTGFRMTFRTDVIRRHKFDINLKRYSVFEDRDASYKSWREGAVVGALKAQIFHYRSPEKRDGGRRMGVEQLLNLAYITAANSPQDHPARRGLQRFARYKTFLYSLAARDAFGKDRYNGAKAALREIPAFKEVSPEGAAALYHAALERCIGSEV